jgi:hypothetical protein
MEGFRGTGVVWGPVERSSIIRMLQVKKDEMGRACSTHGGRRMHIGFWWESQKEKGL